MTRFGLALALGVMAAEAIAAQGAGALLAARDSAAESGQGPSPVALRNAGFDAPPDAKRNCPSGWFCTMHANPRAFRFEVVTVSDADRHLKVTRVAPEPWAMGRQDVPIASVAGRRLRLSMMVNTEATEGEAGPVLHFKDGSGGVVGGAQNLGKAFPGWRRLSVEGDVTGDVRGVEVGFLIEGGGTTLFDDVRLEVVIPATEPGK